MCRKKKRTRWITDERRILGLILALLLIGPVAVWADIKPRFSRVAAEDWFWRQRAAPAGNIPADVAFAAAVRQATDLQQVRTGSDGAPTWTPLGPAPIQNVNMYGGGDLTASGRALAIAIDPIDSNILLLGAAQGGIWRSTDGGRSFASVGDNLPSQAINVIRHAPSDPRIVYAGSGEPHSKTSIFGMGVFKSTDSGRKWFALPSSGPGWDFRYVSVSGLQVDPQDPNKVYVTTADVLPDRVDVFHPPPGTPPCGVFKSTDGGMSWKVKQLAVDYRKYDFQAHDPYLASGYGFVDLELLTLNPNVLFAAERSGGIYTSTDAGETWTRVTPVKNPGGAEASGATFPAPVPRFSYFDPDTVSFITYPVLPRSKVTPEFNRVEIGLAQGGPGIVGQGDKAVLYAGYSTILLLDINGNGRFDDGVDIEQPTALLFKTINGGGTWNWLGDWANEGIPAYCDPFPTNFNDALYDHVVEVNPHDPNDVIVGGNANYNEYWPDPIVNPTRILAPPWNGVVYRSIDGGATWVNAVPGCARYEPDTDQPPIGGLPVFRCADISSPLSIHPDAMSAAYDWANQRIYVTSDGGLSCCTIQAGACRWEALNNGLGTLQFFDFDVHPSNPDIIQGGMQDNATAYFDGTLWDSWDWDESDGTTGRFDPSEPKRVYIGWQYALARHDNGGGQDPHGWHTLFDGGINGDNDLPFVTLLAIDPLDTSVIYTSSNTTVYRSTNCGGNWTRLNPNPIDGAPTALAVAPAAQHLL